jgi:hypothetical protein
MTAVREDTTMTKIVVRILERAKSEDLAYLEEEVAKNKRLTAYTESKE